MKRLLIAGAMMALMIVPQAQVWADGDELTPAQQKAVQKAVERILRDRGGMTRIDPPSIDLDKPGPQSSQAIDQISGQRTPGKSGATMEGSGNLIYARPFVANPKAIVGGYLDIEYRNASNQGDPSTFDQHRFVPFFYADVSEHVKMAAELEIEHGIREIADNEVSLEFATIDFLIAQPVNFRAGIILLPLGKFNLLHDAPLRDLTDRPFMNTFIIPTTLSETGVGFYGTLYPTTLSKLDYEVYLTTGFNGFDGDGVSVIKETKGLKDARQRKSVAGDGFDTNNGKSVVGRLAFSPLLGVEIGTSGYYGTYDAGGDRSLSIVALDWTFLRGPFELIGESAWAYAENNHLKLDGSFALNGAMTRVLPRRMQGYYIQGNFHFLPSILVKLAPSFFRPEVSTFTGVIRWGESDTNKDVDGDLGQRQRLSVGLNFRPTEDTVFKTAFQYLPETLNNKDQRIHDTQFVASVATYF